MVVAASAVLLVGGRAEAPAPPPAVELRAVAMPATEPPPAPSLPAERPETVEPVAAAVPTPAPARAASPAPRITITDVSSEGVPSEAVIAEIDRVAGRIGACWSDSSLDRRPRTLRAVVTFDDSGRLSQAAVWRGPPPQLQRCVRDALAQVRVSFPAGRASFAIESTR